MGQGPPPAGVTANAVTAADIERRRVADGPPLPASGAATAKAFRIGDASAGEAYLSVSDHSFNFKRGESLTPRPPEIERGGYGVDGGADVRRRGGGEG